MNKFLQASLLSALLGLGAFGSGPAQAHPVARGVHVEHARVLPPGHHRIEHRGVNYAYRDGRFLQLRQGHWVAVRAPVGIVVPVLPRQVSVIVRGAHRHYHHHEVSYRRVRGGWVVDHHG